MELKNRKHPRLKEFDYSSNGAYFVTICTQGKKHTLGTVGRVDPGAPYVRLTNFGHIVDKYIRSIPDHYDCVSVEKYVVMPNHIHLLLVIDAYNGAPGSTRPTISQVITALKRLTNRETGQKLWQTSFHDHIIRDQNDFLTRWQYIDDNTAKWPDDQYYAK